GWTIRRYIRSKSPCRFVALARTNQPLFTILGGPSGRQHCFACRPGRGGILHVVFSFPRLQADAGSHGGSAPSPGRPSTTPVQRHQQLNYCECLWMRCGRYCARISCWFGFLGARPAFASAVGIGDGASFTHSTCRLGGGVGAGGGHLAGGRTLVEGADPACLG